MTLQYHDPASLRSEFDQLNYAREVIRAEAGALREVANRLDLSFLKAVDLLYNCAGRVAVTGTGKSADVGQKIAGTLNSTGTRSYVLDSTRAVHGDLGMVHPDDVVLALSHSGESEEIVRLIPSLRKMANAIIGLTGNGNSSLATQADAALIIGPLDEVCPLKLAPSTSTTAMIAVGDALAFVLMERRQFTKEDFAQYHPAGSLGRKLLKVEEAMRSGPELRLARENQTVREIFAKKVGCGRRTGAVMVTNEQGQLSGIFTDSDLARLFERRLDTALDRPIRKVMTLSPTTVQQGTLLADALDIIRNRKISELPVVDSRNHPLGLIDITDLIGLVSKEEAEEIALVA
ncbi:MAG: SIS domain-containing protein [Gemmataceae bacterium]